MNRHASPTTEATTAASRTPSSAPKTQKTRRTSTAAQQRRDVVGPGNHVAARQEEEARRTAREVAEGRAARVPGAEVAPPLAAPSPLGAGEAFEDAVGEALRARLEAALGADFASVRVHTDAAAAAWTARMDVPAAAFGEHIAFADGAFQPTSLDGLVLIAHELTHVLQQRLAGKATLQFDDPTAETSAQSSTQSSAQPSGQTSSDPPIYMRVHMGGIVVTSPGRMLDPGRPVRAQLLALVLRRLVTDYRRGLEDEVMARLPSSIQRTGGFRQTDMPEGRVPAPDLVLNRGALGTVMEILEDLGHTSLTLTEEQREILLLGNAAYQWYEHHQHRLRRRYPWYTYELFEVHVGMHGARFQRLFQQRLAVLRVSEGGDQQAIEEEEAQFLAEEAGFVGLIEEPLVLLEAIRTSPDLADDDEAPGVWTSIWGERTARRPTRVADGHFAIRLIDYYWRQPDQGADAAYDAEARVEFIRRFARWVGRVSPTVSAGDATQRLIDQPSAVTDPPFPATLTAFPPPYGPAKIVPSGSDRRFEFNVIFPDVFSAFTHYQYAWDVIEREPTPAAPAAPVSETGTPTGLEAATDVEGSRIARETREAQAAVGAAEELGLDEVRRLQGGERASMGDVLGARLSRDLDAAIADIRRINRELGPVGIAASPLYLNALVLRPLGTIIRSFLDIITLSAGPGRRERPIQFPSPGIYIVRVAAMPQVDSTAEVRRPPSVAYMAVFAQEERDFARVQLEQNVETTRETDRARDEYTRELRDLIREEDDPELRDALRELLSEAERDASYWPRAQAMKERLDTRITEIDEEITRIRSGRSGQSGRTAREALEVLRSERRRLVRDRDQLSQLLTTRAGRVEDYAELEEAEPLYVGFVGDNGQAMQLTMEWAGIAREDAAASLRAGAPVGSVFVVVSDHTTPNSGIRQGVGANVDAAVVAAVRGLLESRMGYGRGEASIRLPGGGTRVIRIEADLGSMASEAIENISLVITVASVAAAPFTGGASLTILVPLGIISGGHAAYRMYTRYEASTLRWDLDTVADLVDIVGAVVGGGALIRGARTGMAASRFGRMLAVSYEFAEQGTGYVLLGLGLEKQLEDIENDSNMSEGEKRSRRLMALGSAMLQAGLMVGQRVFKEGADELRAERERRALGEGSTTTEGDAGSGSPRELPPATDSSTATTTESASTPPPTEAPRTETRTPDTPRTEPPSPDASTAVAPTTEAPAPEGPIPGTPRADGPAAEAPTTRTPRPDVVAAPMREADAPTAAETAPAAAPRAPRARAELEAAVADLIGGDGKFTDSVLEAAYARYRGPADRAEWVWRTGGQPLARLRDVLGPDFRPPRTTPDAEGVVTPEAEPAPAPASPEPAPAAGSPAAPATSATDAAPRSVTDATDAALRQRIGDPTNHRDVEASMELHRRYEQRSVRELVQMARRGTRWDGYYARAALDRGRGRRTTVTEYLSEVTNLDQLREMARHDPAAAQALTERYYGLTPLQLERLAETGDGTAAYVLDHPRPGPSMDADVEARLVERVWEQRRRAMEDAEAEAERATDAETRSAAAARGASARSEGTVGALETDIPGVPTHAVRGSPRAPTEMDPGQQRHVRPSTDVALAQNHAEEQLLNWLITQIEANGVQSDALAGRRVRIAVDQQVCSYCLSGVAGGEHAGPLLQFSRRYPQLRLEITDIRTGDFVVFQNGERTVHHRRAGTLDD